MSAPDGATWRSGYATVCKTVYTSSILVVASIHIINGLGRLYQAADEVFGDRVFDRSIPPDLTLGLMQSEPNGC